MTTSLWKSSWDVGFVETEQWSLQEAKINTLKVFKTKDDYYFPFWSLVNMIPIIDPLHTPFRHQYYTSLSSMVDWILYWSFVLLAPCKSISVGNLFPIFTTESLFFLQKSLCRHYGSHMSPDQFFTFEWFLKLN